MEIAILMSQILPKPIRQRIVLLGDPQKYLRYALVANIKWIVDYLRGFISGRRLFLWAAYNGHVDILQSIPNVVMTHDFSEIKCAASKGHLNAVKYLCGKITTDQALLFIKIGLVESITVASTNGHPDVVKFLIDFGTGHLCYENMKMKKNAIDLIVNTAIINNHLNVIKYIIGRYNDENNEKYTLDPRSIQLACIGGHIGVIEYFKSIGLQLDLTNPEYIDLAFKRNQNKMVNYLILHGADINSIPFESITKIDSVCNLLEFQYYTLLLSRCEID